MKQSTYIIAEAGVNHNGELEKALELITVAKEAGADAVKFQTFTAKALVTKEAKKAAYQVTNTGNDHSQYEMLKELELSVAAHQQLRQHCQQQGIEFLSTPFDIASLDLLVDELAVKRVKIGSGDLTNAPLLFAVGQKKIPVILSTGMATLGEIEQALMVLAYSYKSDEAPTSFQQCAQAYFSAQGQETLQAYVTLLHCTSEYPTPPAHINLRAMDTLREAFSLAVGFSDHSLGTWIPCAAVAKGACIIEKHFTLDKGLPGPDHRCSLEPEELKQLVQGIRDVEFALGNGRKLPTTTEIETRNHVRKSVVATQLIQLGESFTEINIDCKRPGDGLPATQYWEMLGKVASKAYQPGELILE